MGITQTDLKKNEGDTVDNVREAGEQLRQQRERVQALLDQLPDTDANKEARALLEAGLQTIDGHIASLRDNPQMAGAILAALPSLRDAVQAVLTNALAESTQQAGLELAEISAAQISRMDVRTMADQFDAAAFAQMSGAQLSAVEHKVGEHLQVSRVAEREAHTTIEALAEANGADLTAYREARARLQAGQALTGDDLAQQARFGVLLSTNSYYGAQEAGGDEELLAKRREQIARDTEAFQLALRAEAARLAEVQGIPPNDRAAFIADHEQQGMDALADEQARLAETRNVKDPVGKANERAGNAYAERGITEGGATKATPADQKADDTKAEGVSAYDVALNEESQPGNLTPAPCPADGSPKPTAGCGL